eukprot:1613472-Pyramimonas_sp.AAC.1
MRPPHPCRHTPYTVRGPRGSSTKGASRSAYIAHIRFSHPLRHTLSRVWAPWGAPPETVFTIE